MGNGLPPRPGARPTRPGRPASSVATLVHDVLEGTPIAREAAAARLAIAGERAEAAVVDALATADAHGRAALLGVLERLATPRALAAAVTALASPDATVATAAVAAVRPHLASVDPDLAARALDALVAASLDPERPDASRLSALEALADAGGDTLAAVRARLAGDGSERIRRAAAGADDGAVAAAARLEAFAVDPGHDAALVQRLVAESGAGATLATLHQLVLALTHRERTAATDAARAGWTLAAASAHAALAARGSRLALADLRDALERLPPERLGELIEAAGRIGDATCLGALAGAWSQAGDGPTRPRVAAAIAALVAREGLNRRHKDVKAVLERWPAAEALLPAGKRRG